MQFAFDIRRIDVIDAPMLESLTAVLQDCVTSGASVGFMNPFDVKIGHAFWNGIRDQLLRGERALLIAERDGRVIGTVQVILAQPPNQPHRGDIAKLLVTPAARECGVGQVLMIAAENCAASFSKTLLVLDTASDAARRLYHRLGWTLCGEIPDYALLPDGALTSTAIYFKRIKPMLSADSPSTVLRP